MSVVAGREKCKRIFWSIATPGAYAWFTMSNPPFHEMVELLLRHVHAGKHIALAAAVGVHESTIYRWHKEGRLPRSRGRLALERVYAEQSGAIRAKRRYAAAAADFIASTTDQPC